MRQKMKVKSKADEVDKSVGKNLRLYRMMSGMSQEALAEAVDLTFQQIQKYELGHNRISASRMLSFANLLNVEVSDFYKGIEKNKRDVEGLLTKLHSLDQESLNCINLYMQITDKKTKKSLLNILKTLQEKKIN